LSELRVRAFWCRGAGDCTRLFGQLDWVTRDLEAVFEAAAAYTVTKKWFDW